MLVISSNHLDLQIAVLGTDTTGTEGYLKSMTVRLTKEDIDIQKDTPLADLVAAEADYDGYGAETVTFNAPSVADDGTVEVIGIIPEFRPTGSTTPNTVFNFFGVAVGDSSLALMGRFDGEGIPMGETTDAIVLTLRYRPSQAFDGVIVS